MDNNGHPVDERAKAPLTSPEKIAALLAELSGQSPDDEETAQLIAMMQMIGPIAARFIPREPAELDKLLLVGARWALALLSDPAAVDHELDRDQVHELVTRVTELDWDLILPEAP
jgi:hypothetical protein